MQRDYLLKSLQDDNYDDIYPSILKRQPSFFKSLGLCLSLSFMRFWHKVVILNTRVKHGKGAFSS